MGRRAAPTRSSATACGPSSGFRDDLDATDDAFFLATTIGHGTAGLTTVVDTLGLDGERRAGCSVATEHGVPCVAVAFDLRRTGRAHNPRAPAAGQRPSAAVLGGEVPDFDQVRCRCARSRPTWPSPSVGGRRPA